MKQILGLLIISLFCTTASVWAVKDEGSGLTSSGEVSGFTFVIPGKVGGKQCVVRGDTANFLPDGVIEIINVKTQVFRENESDIFITSKKATFNKITREVKTDENVQIRSQEMLIRGKGLYWDPHSATAKIFKNVSVKIFSKSKGKGLFQ